MDISQIDPKVVALIIRLAQIEAEKNQTIQSLAGMGIYSSDIDAVGQALITAVQNAQATQQ